MNKPSEEPEAMDRDSALGEMEANLIQVTRVGLHKTLEYLQEDDPLKAAHAAQAACQAIDRFAMIDRHMFEKQAAMNARAGRVVTPHPGPVGMS